MKQYKQILEAINRGVQLALDDFEDSREDIIMPAKETIRHGNNMQAAANFQALINKLHNRTLDKHDTVYIPIWSRLAKEKYKVKDKKELESIIDFIVGFRDSQGELVKGVDNFANLNWLDVSNVTDMGMLFAATDFYGDISQWDVSNVKDMTGMFGYCTFTGVISNWNVSNVEIMKQMFIHSKFNNNISNWDVSNVKDMEQMFYADYEFNQNISNWDVSNVIDYRLIFGGDENKKKMKQEYKPIFKK